MPKTWHFDVLQICSTVKFYCTGLTFNKRFEACLKNEEKNNDLKVTDNNLK